MALNWSASLSGGLPIANYRVDRGTSPAPLSQIAITPNTYYTDSTASPNTTYYYAVQAADTAVPPDLSGTSPPIPATTYGNPSAPANLTATTLSSSKIALTWSVSTSDGLPIASYHIYGGTSPSTLSQIAMTASTSYNNVSLAAGTTYYYAVLAVDTAGDDSTLSNTVSATTLQLGPHDGLPREPSHPLSQ
jgi:fibronectin type 3 domain-containing protein